MELSHREPITVVIPCFNGERFVREAIDSVLKQTSPVSEILVIDDGSTDGSADVVRSIASDVIRLIQQDNGGESSARNRGIDEARGKWIAFLDADDVWEPTKIECQLAERDRLQSDAVVCIHTAYYNFGDWSTIPNIPDNLVNGPHDVVDLLCLPFVQPSTALVRADTPVRFPEWTGVGEDTLYFAELSLHGTFGYVPQRVVGYRKSASQQTRQAGYVAAHYGSRVRWLDIHRADIDPERRRRIEQTLAAALLDRLVIHKGRRDWAGYWAFREHLKTIVPADFKHPVLDERIYPPLVYRLKDWVDGFVKVS